MIANTAIKKWLVNHPDKNLEACSHQDWADEINRWLKKKAIRVNGGMVNHYQVAHAFSIYSQRKRIDSSMPKPIVSKPINKEIGEPNTFASFGQLFKPADPPALISSPVIEVVEPETKLEEVPVGTRIVEVHLVKPTKQSAGRIVKAWWKQYSAEFTAEQVAKFDSFDKSLNEWVVEIQQWAHEHGWPDCTITKGRLGSAFKQIGIRPAGHGNRDPRHKEMMRKRREEKKTSGNLFRSKPKPLTAPPKPTEPQTTVRGWYTGLVMNWWNSLTQEERDSIDSYSMTLDEWGDVVREWAISQGMVDCPPIDRNHVNPVFKQLGLRPKDGVYSDPESTARMHTLIVSTRAKKNSETRTEEGTTEMNNPRPTAMPAAVQTQIAPKKETSFVEKMNAVEALLAMFGNDVSEAIEALQYVAWRNSRKEGK